MTTDNNSFMSQLPFYSITNIDLLSTLDTPENRIKFCLEQNNFKKYVYKSIPRISSDLRSCEYYDEDKLNQITQAENSGLSILHLNIVSLNANMGKLTCLLHSLHHKFDFIALTEIGKINIENQAQAFGDEYEFKHEKPETSKGGVGLFIKNGLSFEERSDLKIRGSEIHGSVSVVENIWYEIKTPLEGQGIIIGVVYRHPNYTVGSINHFTEQLEGIMHKINKEKKRCIITGDLNIDGLKINYKNENNNFYNTVLTQNFLPLITLPTRVTHNTISLIDNILYKIDRNSAADELISGNIFCDISDHLPNFTLLKRKKPQSKENRPMVRIYGEKNTQKFKSAMNEVNWNELYNKNNPNEALEMFYTHYSKNFHTCFPLKRLSKKRSKDKKWVTNALVKSSNYKNMLYRKFLNSPTNRNDSMYKTYKNVFTKCIRAVEDKYYQDLIDNSKNNVRQLWTTIGPIVNPKKVKRNTKIGKLVINNDTITNKSEIANAMNKYFVTIGQKLQEQCDQSGPNYQTYLGDRQNRSLFMFPASLQEITKMICQLKSRKASGDDQISPKILKECIDILSKPVLHIINLTIETGTVPDKLKLAKVIPIYKKDETFTPGNYRPISLLSVLNKIMEKVIHKRLYDFLQKTGTLFKYQFGFREQYSTILALTEIVDNIRDELDKGKYVAGIYLDLSKAFDTVNHDILLRKMEHYGVRGLALNWFESYLSNRQQYTCIDNHKSTSMKVTHGVPQGSVLGPLLFLVYVNDINAALPDSNKLRLYADDTNLFVAHENPTILKTVSEEYICKLFQWFSANKLSVNKNKTCFTIFANKNKPMPNALNSLKVGVNTIYKVPNAKYLGLVLDEKLIWSDHITSLTHDLLKVINAFKIVKSKISHKHKQKMYYAYIHSKIQYGIELYGHAADTNLKKVQTLQNKALKILYNRHPRTDTEALHRELKLLKVKDIQKLNILSFVYKQKHNKLPPIFNDMFRPFTDIHNHLTRQRQNLHRPPVSLETGDKTMKSQGPELWNKLPRDIQEINSYYGFRKKTKDYLMKDYKKSQPEG